MVEIVKAPSRGEVVATKLQALIEIAAKKIGAQKESEICRFLPGADGCYLHHLVFLKMKRTDPGALGDLINKFILSIDKPVRARFKVRIRRVSANVNKRRTLSHPQMQRNIELARAADDREIVSVLSPRLTLTAYRRALVGSIRRGEVKDALWNDYVWAMQTNRRECEACVSLSKKEADDLLPSLPKSCPIGTKPRGEAGKAK